jgi:hypothetical protein
MRILSYNLFWRVFDCHGQFRRCIYKSENVCVRNIRDIIMDVGKEPDEIYPDYDFMSFQEVRIKQIMRMDFPNGFINNYKIIYMAIGNNTVSIFYNKKYHLIKKIGGNLTKTRDPRPFLIAVFREKIIYITIHFPHNNFKMVLKNIFMILRTIPQYWDPTYNIILSGDFNHTPDLDYLNQLELVRTFYNSPTHYTCCRENRFDKYEKKYDNIFTTFGPAIEYKTLSNPEKYNINNVPLMSDHLPIYCKIPNTLTAG